MKKFFKTAGWIFQSFGPLVSFYVVLKVWGLLPAIISGLAIGAVLVAYEIWREKRASAMTIFTAASVAIFGALDLRFQTGFFVKLEPALGNVATAIFFLGTVVIGRPLIVDLAEKQSGTPLSDTARAYMRNVTVVWGLLFLVRAAGYVWMAYNLSLERALVIRGIAGPIFFGVMLLGEMGYRYLRFGKKAFGADEGAESVPTAPEV